MLHAPDFLGYAGAVELARDAPAAVERGLALKRTGNDVMALVGGREIHPINVRVGGFYRAPTPARAAHARRAARARPRGGARDRPLDGRLRLPRAHGRVRARRAVARPTTTRSSAAGSSPTPGLDISPAEYDEHFEEEHVERSTALHSRLRERGTYLCGPLARFSLNFDRLSPLAREAAREAGLEAPCRDPFRSIVVRSVELVYACDEALRLIDAYEEPDAPAVPVEPVAGTGYGVERGAARPALPPLPARRRRARSSTRRSSRRPRRTSWRSRTTCATSSAATPSSATTQLRALCEQTIRNYDPCISCATHFLDLEVERR